MGLETPQGGLSKTQSSRKTTARRLEVYEEVGILSYSVLGRALTVKTTANTANITRLTTT